MNVKPGDLAIIVGGLAKGAIVEALVFGDPMVGRWLCKFIGGPGPTWTSRGIARLSYTCVRPEHLRPLPGIPDDITTEREETV